MKPGIWIGLVALGLLGTTGYGAGFQLYTEGSAEALGQAAAISGRDDLLSLAWYNPSALAGTEQSAVMAGSVFVQVRSDFNSAFGSAFNASMSDEWRTIPHLYGVLPISENLTTLLSANTPYGLITEWPGDWAGKSIATYSELQAVYITPSLACRINDQLRVSAGFNVVSADAELNSVTTLLGNEIEQTLSGNDTGYGYTASVRYQPLRDWAMGARYQSRVALEMEGEVSADPLSVDGSVDLTLPSSFNVGIANTTISNLTLDLDLIWTEWSTYDQLAVATPLSTTVVPKDWDDVWSVRVGGEYAIGTQWALRAGYVWDQSPVPDRTRSPELPGSDRQMLMVGLGWKSESLSIDLAYSYLWAEKVSSGTEVVEWVPTLAGSYETVSHLIGLSVGYTY